MQAWGGFFAYTAAWLTATAEIISWVTEINVWVTENGGNTRLTLKFVADALQTHGFSQQLRTPLFFPGADKRPGY